MKKLNLTISAPDVDILAKILIQIIENISDYPDAKIDSTEYQDESTREKMKQLIAKSVSNQNKQEEKRCSNCKSSNIGAWGPDNDKCFDCEMTWEV